MELNQYIIVACVIAIIAVIMVAVASTRSDSYFSPYKKKRLLTSPEIVFYHKLQGALKGTGLIVGFQVSMGALIDLKRNIEPKKRMGYLNRFNRKIVDYVIMSNKGEALLLIELDDRTHNKAKDELRDALTRSAGYSTLRYRGVKSVDIDQLRYDIIGEINKSKS